MTPEEQISQLTQEVLTLNKELRRRMVVLESYYYPVMQEYGDLTALLIKINRENSVHIDRLFEMNNKLRQQIKMLEKEIVKNR